MAPPATDGACEQRQKALETDNKRRCSALLTTGPPTGGGDTLYLNSL